MANQKGTKTEILIWPRIFCSTGDSTGSVTRYFLRPGRKECRHPLLFSHQVGFGIAVIQRAKERFTDWTRAERMAARSAAENWRPFSVCI